MNCLYRANQYKNYLIWCFHKNDPSLKNAFQKRIIKVNDENYFASEGTVVVFSPLNS
jgi:hypothetical protein